MAHHHAEWLTRHQERQRNTQEKGAFRLLPAAPFVCRPGRGGARSAPIAGRPHPHPSPEQTWTESMFLDAAIQLGSSAGVFSAPQAREMENLAFDWIINGEKYVDSRFPELLPLRLRV